jgi:hypothetical protein
VLEHIRPSAAWFAHGLDPPLNTGCMAGSVPDRRADGESARCPESLCPNAGCDPHWGDVPSISSEDVTPPSSLLRTHAPVSASSLLLRFVAWLEESLQIVYQSLLLAGPSRRYCLRIFPMMPGPLSRRFAECLYLFLPLQQRPSPPENGSALIYRKCPLKRLHSGGTFRDCSHFFMFRPHSLLATLVAPTTCSFPAGQLVASTSGQNVRRCLRTHRIC